jgi:sodium-coupled monocarboxylate transporter 8/12
MLMSVSPRSHWGTADALVFGVYMVASVALGLSFAKGQKDLKGYLLAGHRMPWPLVAISIVASLFSGASFLGAPAEVFSHNLMYLWAVLALAIATPITAILFVPHFYNANFYTAYEFLEKRFDLRLRLVSSGLFIIRVTLWLTVALYAPALAISEVTGWPLATAILISGLSTVLYTALGGMKAVIYTDVMQFTVLFVGIVVIAVIAVSKIPGGIEGAWSLAGTDGRTEWLDARIDPTARVTIWGALLGGAALALVQMVTDQVSVQRYLTASSLKASQRALWLKLFISLPFVSLFYFMGVILYAFYKSHPEALTSLTHADRVLPYFVVQQLPSPFPGLLVAAILAATMSTVSSGINALTTATFVDFIERLNPVPKSELQKVRQAKWLCAAYGLTCTGLAFFISNMGSLLEAPIRISGIFGGPLLGVFFLGVLSRRVTGTAALCAGIVGSLTVGAMILFSSVSFMWYAVSGALLTFILGNVFSRLTPATEPKTGVHQIQTSITE